MLTVLLTELSSEWVDRISRHLAERALVLQAEGTAQALSMLWSSPPAVLVASMESLTAERLASWQQMAEAAPKAVRVCLAPEAVMEHARNQELFSVAFWLRPGASPAEVAEILDAALEKAELLAKAAKLEPSPPASADITARSEASPPASKLFQRLISSLVGGLDTDHVLSTYVEAVVEFTCCASYCLLWRLSEVDPFAVYAAQGLHPQLIAQGELLPTACLPSWYRHNGRILTRNELAAWPEGDLAVGIAGELELFRGQVAVPLMREGWLAGILILGDKALGEPYSPGELETLFLLTNYVAAQIQSFELHRQLRQSKAYVERILSGMASGVITLGPDEKIAVCNPYAARILHLSPKEVEGQDLRCLPSPLGDLLYAALRSPPAAVSGEEVTLLGGELTVRVTTSPLLDDQGLPLGSMMLLEDMTAHIALAAERYRRERLDMLAQIMGRLAHEVKTPLTAIKTYVELAGGASGDEELNDFWNNTVNPQIDRLDTLVNQLVQIVQQPGPNFELVRVESLAEEAINQLRQSEQESEPVFELEVNGVVPRVIADPEPTREALFYLLRYLQGKENSPVSVSIASHETELGDAVQVTMQRLRRNGEAIQPEKLFDPLYALEQNDPDLGPVISHTIMDNQGGKVEAKNNNGKLEFRLTFPIDQLDTGPPGEET